MTSNLRKGVVERSTKETRIKLELTIDGAGNAEFQTGVPFLEHMLTLFAVHGLFDLRIDAAGDLSVDAHHTVEDIGICLGDALKKALGDRSGIKRYGAATIPMDEACASVVLDLSNRPYLVCGLPELAPRVGLFDTELIPEFFRALCTHGGVTLHIQVHYGSNTHHIIEAVFKAFGRALDEATRVDERRAGIASSKGSL
ncbi:MAG: imidazoleglycerol-phosphate dehydratase HisB [Syntrophobacteraceae bacterium]